MPPLPELAGTVQAVIGYSGPGGTSAVNVFHLLTTGAPTQQDMLGLSNGIMGALNTPSSAGVASQISPDWTITGVTCTQLTAPYQQAASSVASLPGTASGALSPNVAACVSWAAPVRYRGGKPRTYMPGIPGNVQQTAGGSLFVSNYADAVQNTWSEWLAAVNKLAPTGGGTWSVGLLRRISGTAGGKPVYLNPPQFYPFTSCSVNERMASQRRRNGKLQKTRV